MLFIPIDEYYLPTVNENEWQTVTNGSDDQERDENGRWTASGHAQESARRFNVSVDKIHKEVRDSDGNVSVEQSQKLQEVKERFVTRTRANVAKVWKDAEAKILEKHGDTPITRSLLASRKEHINELVKGIEDSASVRSDQPHFHSDVTREDRDAARQDVQGIAKQIHKEIAATDAYVEQWKTGTGRNQQLQETQKFLSKIEGREKLTPKQETQLAELQKADRWATIKKGAGGSWQVHTPSNTQTGAHYRLQGGSLQMFDSATNEPTSPLKLEQKRKTNNAQQRLSPTQWVEIE